MRSGIVGIVAVVLGVNLGAASVGAQCSTVDADMNGVPDVCPAGTTNVIIGNATSQTLTGTGGIDCIFGLGGDDTIDGLGGNDYLCGGDGNDTIYGRAGNDTIYGEGGDDFLNGNGGDDTIDGGIGNDAIAGNGGADTIFGQDGVDIINGGPQDDVIRGGDGDDILSGGTGNDDIDGEGGNDTISGNGGDDTLSGGAGLDDIDGGQGNDTLFGGSARDMLDGGAGNDVLYGGTADDTLLGGIGVDILYGEAGNDTLIGGPDNDTLWGGTGTFDSADGSAGFDNCLQAATTVNCELFSHAVVASFGAIVDEGEVVLRWVTVSEAATVGFYVYRDDGGSWEQIHEGLLPALHGVAQGGIYDLRDSTAWAGESNRYLLVEVDNDGIHTEHGPFEASANLDASTMTSASVPFAREAHVTKRRLVVAKTSTGERQRAGEAVGIFFGVPSTGVYSVPSTEIAARLGLSDEALRTRIQEGSLELTDDGEPVAWTTSPDGSALRFIGFATDSLFSRERFYRLGVGAGVRMERSSRPPLGTGSQVAFLQTAHAEEDLIPGVLAAGDGRVDYWFWRFASASPSMPEDAAVEIDLEGVVPGGVDALVRIEVQGISDVVHEAEVELNGVTLGTTTFEGDARHIAQWPITASKINDGANALAVTAKGSAESTFYLDSVEITFERSYETTASTLEFKSSEDSDVAVVGNFGDAPLLFDISQPLLPRLIDDFTIGSASGGDEIAFDARPGERYFVAAASSVKTPSSIWNDVASHLHDSSNRAEYLVISPALLYDSARALVEYRRTEGFQAMLVELQDVFDEFSGGQPDPEAIRTFLRYTRERWEVAPRYVVLIGKGSLDYRDLMGAGGNLMPPIMVGTQKGLFSSDNHFADFEGTDNVPEIALGRLPVSTPEQLDALIGRIAAYEEGIDDLGKEILLLADQDDAKSSFSTASDALAELLEPDWDVVRDYLSQMTVEIFRATLFEELARSPRVVHYLGHGGLNLLGKSGLLFQADDVPNIELSGAQPIYMLMTCSTSRFAVPGFVSLGEALVLDQNGAAAVWGPSGLSIDEQAQALARDALEVLLAGGDVRLGDALLAAYAGVGEGDGREDMPAIYHLFGDPALRVSKADPVTVPGVPIEPGDNPSAPGLPTITDSPSVGTGCAIRYGSADFSLLAWFLISAVAVVLRRRRRH